jgi:hypothetical protein
MEADMKHDFRPSGGIAENPGVRDNGNGGLIYTDSCVCGVTRKRGVDYTHQRPGNDWGPHYYDAKRNRIPRAGECQRETVAA